MINEWWMKCGEQRRSSIFNEMTYKLNYHRKKLTYICIITFCCLHSYAVYVMLHECICYAIWIICINVYFDRRWKFFYHKMQWITQRIMECWSEWKSEMHGIVMFWSQFSTVIELNYFFIMFYLYCMLCNWMQPEGFWVMTG